MKKLILALFMITYVGHGVLVQFNRFLDSSPPCVENLQVESIGKYYQPFRVDYFTGRSKSLGKQVRVKVLPKRAEAAAIGDEISIVVGSGLFHKTWLAPKDKHDEYSDSLYKVLYLGIMSTILAIMSVAYFVLSRKVLKYKQAFALFGVSIVASIILFYLF